jgi:hypothetical protein
LSSARICFCFSITSLLAVLTSRLKAFSFILIRANFIQVLKEILKFITVKNGFTPFSFLMMLSKMSLF